MSRYLLGCGSHTRSHAENTDASWYLTAPVPSKCSRTCDWFRRSFRCKYFRLRVHHLSSPRQMCQKWRSVRVWTGLGPDFLDWVVQRNSWPQSRLRPCAVHLVSSCCLWCPCWREGWIVQLKMFNFKGVNIN